jgi:hypothetical protein
MAGSYYVQADAKVLLKIAAADTTDDTLIDSFGAVANQHIDNILEIYDEKIPLQGTNVLEDIKKAANFYVAQLYHSHRNNPELAEHWKNLFNQLINGLKAQRVVDNPVYTVERHMGRGGRGSEHDHFFADW